MVFSFLVPKKFLCYYSLYNGAIFVAIFMAFTMLLTGIALLIQVMRMESIVCDRFVWSSAFGFNITAIIYNCIMFLMCAWLLWAVKKGKPSVMLVWVVVTTVWLIQTFILLIVFIYLYHLEVNKTAGILSFIFGPIAVAVIAYLILIVFGHRQELKKGIL